MLVFKNITADVDYLMVGIEQEGKPFGELNGRHVCTVQAGNFSFRVGQQVERELIGRLESMMGLNIVSANPKYFNVQLAEKIERAFKLAGFYGTNWGKVLWIKV